MCPLCITAATATVASTLPAGGLMAFLARFFHLKNSAKTETRQLKKNAKEK